MAKVGAVDGLGIEEAELEQAEAQDQEYGIQALSPVVRAGVFDGVALWSSELETVTHLGDDGK